MPNTINIVQPKAEDGVTEVSFVTRTNSIFKSDGTPLGDSMDAYMDEVDEISQNLTELFLVESKSAQVTTTTQQFSVEKTGYTPLGIVGFAIANTAAQINYMLISGNDVSLRATNSTAFYYNVLYAKNLV